jgi:hypothetical protein
VTDSKYYKLLAGGAVSRGTPDMEVVRTDEKHVRQAIRTGVGEALRNYYDDHLKEPIPGRLTNLLRRLDELTKSSEEQE